MLELSDMLDTLLYSTALSLAAMLWYYSGGHRERRLLAEMPGPRGHPLIGSLLDVWSPRDQLLPRSVAWAKEFGGIFKVKVFGWTRVILTGPEEIEVMLKCKQNIAKDSCYRFIHPWLGTGIITSSGSKWQRRRRMLAPTFHYNILEGYISVFNRNAAILVDIIRSRCGEDSIEINDLVSLCALDIVCESSMGTSIGAQKNIEVEYVRAVKRMCEIFMIRQFSPWLHNDLIFQLSALGSEQKRVVQVLRQLTNRVIAEKRAEFKKKEPITGDENENVKGLSLLELLIAMSEQGELLEDEDIREEVSTVMFAGHDSVTGALTAALYEVGCHKDIQEKLVAEMSNIFGSDWREPTFSDLQKMTYMDMVLKEVLRLYPSVPGFSRLLETDVKIGRYTIPAGCEVAISPYVIHRNPDIYPDPEKFDPERFSPDRASKRHPYSYIPFSAGPRNCVGHRYARLEQKCILTYILRNFTIESVDRREDVKLVMDILLKTKRPYRLRFTPRSQWGTTN